MNFFANPTTTLRLLEPLAGANPDAVLGLCTEPRLLGAIARGVGTQRIAAIGPARSIRHKDHDTIVAPVPTVLPLLREANARFDLVIATPTAGEVWPSAGIPLPLRGNATRRMSIGDGTVDAIYAAWAVAHELLSPVGEGVLIADAAPLMASAMISGCPLASRIWFMLELPDDRLAIYFGAQHRNLTGEPPCDVRWKPTYRFNGERASRARHNQTKISLDRFGMCRAEHVAITTGVRDPHIALDRDGCFTTHVTGFERVSGRVIPTVNDSLDKLRHKHPLSFVQQAAALRELRALLGNPALRIAPGVSEAVERARVEHEQAATPFNRPTNAQAIAWLDTQDSVRCKRDFFAFKRGEGYKVTSRIFQGVKIERRRTVGGPMEEVEVSGMEMAVIVQDALGGVHSFTQNSVDEKAKGVLGVTHAHSLSDLLASFEMPDVPDVQDQDPMRFSRLVAKLRKMERAPAANPHEDALARIRAMASSL